MKIFKAWFYRKGRLFPPYVIISLFLFGGIVMVVFRLIPYMQDQLKIDNPLILGYLGFVFTFCGIWSKVVTKDKPINPCWDGIKRRIGDIDNVVDKVCDK